MSLHVCVCVCVCVSLWSGKMSSSSSKGEIVYASISRGALILAEYSARKGDFKTATNKLLGHMKDEGDKRITYTHEEYAFHIDSKDGLICLALADQEMGRALPFKFLRDIRQRFVSAYGQRWQDAQKLEMSSDFKRVLQKQMDYFSHNPDADQVAQVRREIDQVKDIMTSNIDKILERGERIELLVDRTSDLEASASQFRTKSTKLRRYMCCQNWKMTFLLLLIVGVVIFVIVLIACGGFSFSKCR